MSLIWSGAAPPGTSCTYAGGGSSCSYPNFDLRVLVAWVSLLAALCLFILGWQLGNRREGSKPNERRGRWVAVPRVLDGRILGKGGLLLTFLLVLGTVIFSVVYVLTHPFPAY